MEALTHSPGRRQERFWNQLLSVIARQNVVPVVGDDMLLIDPGPPPVYLYDELARRYASFCGFAPPEGKFASLSSTVRSHPEFRDNPHDIYQGIGEELDDWRPPVPQSLLNLAKIRHFSLFISTTFDDSLEHALNQERFDGAAMTRVLAYSPKRVPTDYEVADALNSGRPVVIKLFGSYKNPLQFALTEGDKVEYMHALQSTEYCPKRLFNELYERPLLLLGNKFPDWMARSFLRMTRKTPLDHRDVPKQYFANAESADDPILKFFLQRFTTNTEIIEDMDPVVFTNTLAEKWLERCKEGADREVVAEIQAKRPMARNSVFISYCASRPDGSEAPDKKAAFAIRDSLEAAGVSVWLDHDQLKGGDEYERKIERYINTCSLFVCLISATANSRPEGFFRKEWGWALRRLADFTGSSRTFVVPVKVGNIDPYTAAVPDEFKRLQFLPLPDRGPDPEFVDYIRSHYLLNNTNTSI